MPFSLNLAFGLAFLVPIGYTLIAASAVPAERARHAAVSFLAALGLAVIGYAIAGFALQYGGIGLLRVDEPGFDGLIWEWSALGPTWGPGWGMAGLSGWGLAGAGASAAARTLALATLPWVVAATAIPVAALRGRIPTWANGLLGLLMGALVFPTAGNWILGGGWLANLGSNLGLGAGFIDVGGAGLVHLLGAAAALAGLVVFLPRAGRPEASEGPAPLPAAHLPLLALLGAGLLLIGIPAWMAANVLRDPGALGVSGMFLNVLLAGGAGALLSLAYTWLVAGRPDVLMAARGLGAAVAASMAAAWLIAPWAALLLGAVAGLLTPLAVFAVGRVLRLDDETAVLTVHGLGGALGLLAAGVFARDTAAGAPAVASGQLQGQILGVAAIALFGFFAAWLALAAARAAGWLLRPSAVPAASSAGEGEPPA